MKKAHLNVKGMHCHGCEMLIKLSLKELAGVENVEAWHEKGGVIVEYDEKKVKLDDMFLVIKENGYEPVSGEVIS